MTPAAGCRLSGEVIAGHAAAARALHAAHDWRAFATLPADAFWRQLQLHLREGQALAQVAMTAQTAFANGLQQAPRTWRKDSAAALGEALGGALGMGTPGAAGPRRPRPRRTGMLARRAPARPDPAAQAAMQTEMTDE